VEGPLSTLEKLCLASFLHHSYAVHLYTYGEVAGVPEGVVKIPGDEILPRERLFLAPGVQAQSFAAFSDLFRYELLVQRGGWWFDMDFVCLRHDPPPDRLRFASTWEGEYGECANGCAMWCLPNDPHMIALRDRCEDRLNAGEASFGSIGPSLVQGYIEESGLGALVSPFWEFCPWPWRMVYRLALNGSMQFAKDLFRGAKHRAWEFVDPNFKAAYIRPRSRAIHLHNEMWKACGLDKNSEYFPWCSIEKFKRQYLTHDS
jgi:hypothetical protein